MKKVLIVFLSLLLLFGVASGLILKNIPEASPGNADESTTGPTSDPAPAVPWDGVTVTAPEGKGTYEEPYLIESGANLAWISAEIGDGTVESGVFSDPFATSFFVQTKDIDLGGHAFNSIGYYVPYVSMANIYNTTEALYVFGGYYDGANYKICNGLLQNPAQITSCDPSYGTGLFGAIQGATVRNVHLEGISLASENHVASATLSHGSAGFVVGIAALIYY